jgi:type I restriction enzyme S subunit
MSAGWRTVALADVLCEARERVRVSPQDRYPIAGVLGFGRGLLIREPVTGSGVAADHLYRIRAGQIMYSRLKAFEGAFALVPPAGHHRFVSNEFPTFDVDVTQAHPEFIELLLQRPETWRELASGSQGMGARRERLQPRDFLDYDVELPPLATQQLIVDAIRAFRRASAASREQAAAAHRLGTVMYREFVRDGQTQSLRFEDFAAHSIEHVHIEPSAEYRLAGVSIAGGGLFWRPVMRGTETRYPKMHRLRSGALVYRKLTAWEGPITVVPDEFDGAVVSPEFPTFALDERVVSLQFVAFLCRMPSLHAEMRARSTGTAERRNRLKPEDMLRMPVELPSLERQEHIGALHLLSKALMAEASALDVSSVAYREHAFAQEPVGDEEQTSRVPCAAEAVARR